MRSSLIPYRVWCVWCLLCPQTPLATEGAAEAEQSCNRCGRDDAGPFLPAVTAEDGQHSQHNHTWATAECVFPRQRSQATTASKTVSITDFRESTKALHLSKLWLKGCVWPNCAIMNHILKEHGVKSPHEEYLISVTLTQITSSVQLLHLGSKIIHHHLRIC